MGHLRWLERDRLWNQLWEHLDARFSSTQHRYGCCSWRAQRNPLPFWHLSPEIRYTHWGAKHFLSQVGDLSSIQNQAEFLLGLTF